ncbi:hypothetical protein [Blastopirellula marina]|uniref:Uncharacterized protein n=1 Tax=Blastopirellula marina TaxID=124 RepID=A0A2S8GC90_9BACT|nr:hypothetical protein [Blastopirellula marina]PQO42085.1 hypothetical protein C5Y93_27430 [Blastopirellula marina]
MSVFRNLLIVGLLICVAYNGYVIYRNQMVTSPPPAEEAEAETPLFNPEAFATLAENRSHAAVQPPPTVVNAEALPTTNFPAANPVLETSPGGPSQERAPEETLAQLPLEPKTTSRFTQSSPATPIQNAAEETTPEPKPEAAEEPDTYLFDQAWAKIEEADANFKWPVALREIQELLKHPGLTPEQREQILTKGDKLAELVILAPNKHLAQPGATYFPNESLEQIAQKQQLPLAMLRLINGWNAGQGPTPGDWVKILQGPFSMQVDLPNEEIRLSVDGMYAGRIPIGKRDVRFSIAPFNGLVHEETGEQESLTVGDVPILIQQENVTPPRNSIQVAQEKWPLLAALADPSVKISLTPDEIYTPSIEEAAVIETAEQLYLEVRAAQLHALLAKRSVATTTSTEPVDALKLQIFTPQEKAVQGTPVNYGIEVTNLSEETSEAIQVVVNLSEGIEPLKVAGHTGKIGLGQAVFDPIALQPGKSIRLTVTIDTRSAGNFVVRPEVQCQSPSTRYATEIQLQITPNSKQRVVSDSPPIARPAPEVKPETKPKGAIPPLPQDIMAEAPLNPATEIR